MDLCDLGYFDKAFELINLIILTHNQTYERSKCYYHIMFKMLTNGISLKEIEALPQFEKITFHKKKLLKNYDLISSVANVNQESIFEKILAETEKAQEILVDNFNFNDLIKYLHWTCAFDNKERLFSMGIYKLVQKSTTPQHLAECVQIYRNFSGKSSEISSNYDSLITGYASIGFFQQANELLEEFIKLSHETAITLIPEQKNIYEKKMIDFAKSIKQRVEIFKK